MGQSQDFKLNVEDCAQLTAQGSEEPTRARYKRMEVAWRALAVEQDWLDGIIDQSGKSGG